uniref:Calcium binding protein 2b n=1 Tax=Sinocyclocheilus anshuiensis TaxID=1608454 RepID=A0A671R8L1_9TELE
MALRLTSSALWTMCCIFLWIGKHPVHAFHHLYPCVHAELREAFKEFDRNKGYINCRDLGECMRTMGYMPTEMELIELSQQISELLHHSESMICVPSCKHYFAFDSNGDGQISIIELREAMKKLMGEQLNPRDIDDILRDADLNGDGLVDFEEFVRMMSR